MFLSSCKDFQNHQPQLIHHPVSASTISRIGSRLLPPRGPRRRTGTGSGRGRPHHSSGAANSRRGRGGDKSFDSGMDFRAEKCYYYLLFHWKGKGDFFIFNPLMRVIYLSLNYVLIRMFHLNLCYFVRCSFCVQIILF